MAQQGLLDLAKEIGDRLGEVVQLLEENDLETTNIERDGYPAGAGFEELTVARLQLLKAAHDLEYIAMGRKEWLKTNLAVTKWDHLCYYMIDQYKLYKYVPLDGEISYDELSKASGLPLDALKRILRHAYLNHLFSEPRPGYVAHSEASELFVTDPTMASWLGHNYDEVFRSIPHLPEALKKWPNPTDPGHTACALAFDQPKGMFPGLFQEQPWRAARFAGAMQAVTQGSHDPSHVVGGYDWAKHGDALVVDVGGSSGFVSVAVAKEFPNLRFVVQDIEDHSAKLTEHVSAAGVASEFQFQVHDFFKPNPQPEADVYFLRHIIHDWDDASSVNILRGIAGVMKPTAKIVIGDIVVPGPGVAPWQANRMIGMMDLQMMVMVNGKERTEQEWDLIVKMAHPDLSILAIRQPPHSVPSIIEIGFTRA